MGIAAAALTYPVVELGGLLISALVIGFGLTFLLILFTMILNSPLPSHLLGQEAIIAPILLGSLVRVGGSKASLSGLY